MRGKGRREDEEEEDLLGEAGGEARESKSKPKPGPVSGGRGGGGERGEEEDPFCVHVQQGVPECGAVAEP